MPLSPVKKAELYWEGFSRVHKQERGGKPCSFRGTRKRERGRKANGSGSRTQRGASNSRAKAKRPTIVLTQLLRKILDRRVR